MKLLRRVCGCDALRLRFATIQGNGACGQEDCRGSNFRNAPSCTDRRKLAIHQLLAEAGNVASAATQPETRRGLALQEQFLSDEAKGDSHSEAGQQEESFIFLGTGHQGKCQQEEKGLSGAGSRSRQFCLFLDKVELRNHRWPLRGHGRKVKETAVRGMRKPSRGRRV